MGKPRLVRNANHSDRTATRQALAEAISRRDRRRRDLEQARTGIIHAERYVSEAYAQQEQAIAAVAAARKQTRSLIQEAAIGGRQLGPDQRLREARMSETEAADNIEATKEALANLRAKIGPLEFDLQVADDKVSNAAKAVMAEELGDWPQQFLRLHEHYVAQLAALDWLVRHDVVPKEGDKGPTPSGTVVYNTQFAPQVLMQEVQSDRHPSRIKWQQAFTALCLDPDAELPRDECAV